MNFTETYAEKTQKKCDNHSMC